MRNRPVTRPVRKASVTLRPVTRANWRQVVRLTLRRGQDRYVASNPVSLAQAHYQPWYVPYGVYAGAVLVGFVLLGRDPRNRRMTLMRLMIAAGHQGKGHGRAALQAVIGRLRHDPACRSLWLSYVPGNRTAERLYRDAGFEPTGEVDEDGEIVSRLRLRGGP